MPSPDEPDELTPNRELCRPGLSLPPELFYGTGIPVCVLDND